MLKGKVVFDPGLSGSIHNSYICKYYMQLLVTRYRFNLHGIAVALCVTLYMLDYFLADMPLNRKIILAYPSTSTVSTEHHTSKFIADFAIKSYRLILRVSSEVLIGTQQHQCQHPEEVSWDLETSQKTKDLYIELLQAWSKKKHHSRSSHRQSLAIVWKVIMTKFYGNLVLRVLTSLINFKLSDHLFSKP